MEQVFHPPARSTVLAVRPKTVACLDYIRLGHTTAVDRHIITTAPKHGPRDKPILQQRYPSYPVAVPDISKDACQETLLRRTIHGELYELDPTAFRRKFYPECTADVFHQKHLVRDYLATMHPYSDPNDHGRTYNQSRLKSRGESREGGRGSNQGGLDDFIHDDPVRPRSTGYSKGHVRNLLSLDTFGERSSEEIRAQREQGLLPASPNTDRYKNAPLSPSSTTSTASSVSPPRRPNTTGMHNYPVDSKDVYFPLPLNFQPSGQARSEGLAGAESFVVLETAANLGNEFAPPDRPTGRKVKVVPGTIGYAGPAITREDVVLKDPHGKGVEYFNAIMTRKHTRAERSLSKSKEARRLRELQQEAMQAATHIADFESNLRKVLATQRPL